MLFLYINYTHTAEKNKRENQEKLKKMRFFNGKAPPAANVSRRFRQTSPEAAPAKFFLPPLLATARKHPPQQCQGGKPDILKIKNSRKSDIELAYSGKGYRLHNIVRRDWCTEC
jgi:hypothetical protein